VLSEVTGNQTCPVGRLVPRSDSNTALCLDQPSP
jgi:hypothetical protein